MTRVWRQRLCVGAVAFVWFTTLYMAVLAVIPPGRPMLPALVHAVFLGPLITWWLLASPSVRQWVNGG